MPDIPFRSHRSRFQLAWVAIGSTWLLGLMLAWPGSLIGDEWVHYHQIARFRGGDFTVLVQWLTTIPGYHWAVSVVLYLFGADSSTAARVVSAAFGVGAVVAFFALRRETHCADAQRATMQFAVLPIVFPFFFLVYTDVLSVALILAATFATSRHRHLFAALILTASVGVRQNNVLWAGLLAVWAIGPLWTADRRSFFVRWREVARIVGPYSIPVVAFLGYWAWNGSVTYSNSQSAMHPAAAFHAGNPYFALFLLSLLMPLHVIAGLVAFVRKALARPGWWLWPLFVFALFRLTFSVDHHYNHIALDVNIRNAWLMLVKDQAWAWWIFGAAATAAATALSAMPMARTGGGWMMPFSLVYLAASWLIEPRYSFIPLALYLAMRKPLSDRIEIATLALWALFAVYLADGIFGFRLII